MTSMSRVSRTPNYDLDNDDVHKDRKANPVASMPVPHPYKVRFTYPGNGPISLPGFQYVPTALTQFGITYTALVDAHDPKEATEIVTASFPGAGFDTVTESDRFEAEDIIPGALVRGTIKSRRHRRGGLRGWLVRLFIA